MSPQIIRSSLFDWIQVDRIWQNLNLMVALVIGGKILSIASLLGETCPFYLRLRPSPERIARKQDLEKSILDPLQLQEALFWQEKNSLFWTKNSDDIIYIIERKSSNIDISALLSAPNQASPALCNRHSDG